MKSTLFILLLSFMIAIIPNHRFFLVLLLSFISFLVNAQTGKVGINTISPQAMLHVMDSSVLFSGTTIEPSGLGAPPASGPGVRMMWYPDKAAFRAGYVSGDNWNRDSIGTFSFATGYDSKASGPYSTAMGYGTASGILSTAMGDFTTASGDYSTAMGEITTASGDYSTAIGTNTNASGIYSTAMGYGTTASGSVSTAMGNSTTASGFNSTSMGFNTKAKPYASLVIGRYNDTTSISSSIWDPLDPVFIIGKGSANNARSNAMTILKNGKTGINTPNPQAMLHVKDSSVLFSGTTSIPGGTGSPPASGPGVRMMWYPAKAAFRVGYVGGGQWDKTNIGNYSIAAGNGTYATGSSSTAFGFGTHANGMASTAMGDSSIANGINSTAMGHSTTASGFSSTSMGEHTTASGYISTAM